MLLTMVWWVGGVKEWADGWAVCEVWADLIIIYKYIIIRISENYFKLRYFWLLYFQHTNVVAIR